MFGLEISKPEGRLIVMQHHIARNVADSSKDNRLRAVVLNVESDFTRNVEQTHSTIGTVRVTRPAEDITRRSELYFRVVKTKFTNERYE